MLIDSFAWIEYKNVKVLTGNPHFKDFWESIMLLDLENESNNTCRRKRNEVDMGALKREGIVYKVMKYENIY